MKFAILTPSRGRPGRLDNFLNSIYNSATNKERIFTYNYIDEDDPRLIAYSDYGKNLKNNDITIGPAQSVSKSWNIIAQKAIDNGADVLIMGNDDMMYRTAGWDIILEEEIKKYPDNIYCMWFEDLIQGEKHCAFPIVSKTWYNTLGYFTPGIFNFGYNDTWIFDLGKRIDRTHFISNAVNEHLHFTTGKAPADETTARNRSQERGNLYELDKVIFEKTSKQRITDSLKLLEIINEKN